MHELLPLFDRIEQLYSLLVARANYDGLNENLTSEALVNVVSACNEAFSNEKEIWEEYRLTALHVLDNINRDEWIICDPLIENDQWQYAELRAQWKMAINRMCHIFEKKTDLHVIDFGVLHQAILLLRERVGLLNTTNDVAKLFIKRAHKHHNIPNFDSTFAIHRLLDISEFFF